MQRALNITAICGWAIPPGWFERQVAGVFPHARVQAVYPVHPQDENEAVALMTRYPADLWIGYSLGSLWLMVHRDRLPQTGKVALLAPILAFPKESQRAGKTPLGQLNYLLKILKRASEDGGPVQEFLNRMDIQLSKSDSGTIPETPQLIRGLEFLRETSVPPHQAAAWMTVAGEEDPLLDGHQLADMIPDLQLVPGAGHHPGPLLQALAERPGLCGSTPDSTQTG